MNTERIEKVLALAMTANPNLPIPLSLDNIDLDDITSTVGSARNTRATMYAIDTGEIMRYVGNSDVVYDRIDIATYWQKSVLIEDPAATTVADLVGIMRTRYGLDVLDTEVLNGDVALPASGDVVIAIDDTVSPLYIGTCTVAFTKDAGLSEQDGVGYTFTVPVASNPIVAYTDTLVSLQGSLNNQPWVGLVATRNKSTKQYEHRFPNTMTQTTNAVRVRGGVVQLMDNDGTYIPLTTLSQYRGSKDATGYCAGIRTLTTIAADVFHYRTDLQYVDYMFDGCLNLVNIPEHLFSACPGLLSAKAVFRATGITTVPVTTFESCTQLTRLDSAFEQCVDLTAVPATLFRSNLALTSLRRCFMGCYSVVGNFATTTLLSGLTKLTDIGYLFADCTSVNNIPAGLLKSQTGLLKADGLFRSCVGITTIPNDLFAYSPKLNTVSYAFMGCNQITGIPPVLFQYTPDLEYMEYTFADTGILTTPAIMFNYTRRLISIDYVFLNCEGLKTIPSALLQPLLRLQSANGVWQGCTGITVIPDALFAYNVNLLSAQWLFSDTGVTTIPSILFAQTVKLTDLTGAFAYTPITTISLAETFRTLVKLRTVSQLFYHCTALTSVVATLFKNNIQLTTLRGAFAYSGLAINVGAIFVNMTPTTVKDIAGLYQGCGNMQGAFATDLKASLSTSAVDWTNSDVTQGCVAGCTKLTDYASTGSIYKTPLPSLV